MERTRLIDYFISSISSIQAYHNNSTFSGRCELGSRADRTFVRVSSPQHFVMFDSFSLTRDAQVQHVIVLIYE
jgi:hypothetical protein